MNIQKEYRKLLSELFWETGIDKEDRTGTGTKSVFGRMLKHDMSLGFPLLTAKKMYFKHAVTELLWILQGRTDLDFLHKHGVNYWNDNYKKSGRSDNTLGPVYGKQLRDFNGHDQLKKILEQIKKEPSSRRIVASLWNPNDMGDMALPPCHYGFQVYINNNKLSLSWNQRSADVFLGLPYDIAMHGLLLQMLAVGSNYEPGELTCFLGDCHLYNDHIEAADNYLHARDKKLPSLEINKGIYLNKDVNIPSHEDIVLLNYNPGAIITAPLSI